MKVWDFLLAGWFCSGKSAFFTAWGRLLSGKRLHRVCRLPLPSCNWEKIFDVTLYVLKNQVFLNQFHQFWVFFASKHWPISTHKFWWSICQNPISCAEVMDEKVILYRFSRKHFVQCDMKNVFASYSKFVSSILGWGQLLISNFLMMYNVSIKAKSPSTVSNRPNLYSVTFWSSYEEVQLYREWIKIRSYKWSSIILSQFWSVETWPFALIQFHHQALSISKKGLA